MRLSVLYEQESGTLGKPTLVANIKSAVGVTQPQQGPASPDGEPLPQWKKGVMDTDGTDQPGHWEDEDMDGDNRPLPAQTKII